MLFFCKSKKYKAISLVDLKKYICKKFRNAIVALPFFLSHLMANFDFAVSIALYFIGLYFLSCLSRN